jgi:hypothetical protein
MSRRHRGRDRRIEALEAEISSGATAHSNATLMLGPYPRQAILKRGHAATAMLNLLVITIVTELAAI